MPEEQSENISLAIKALNSIFDVQRAQQMEANLATMIGSCFESPFGLVHNISADFSAFNLS